MEKNLLEQYDRVAVRNRISTAEFVQDFGMPGKPLLLQGAIEDWPALKLWTPEFFKKKFGNLTVHVQRSYSSNDTASFGLAQYFDYISSTREADPYYLKNWQVHLVHKEIRQHYSAPLAFRSWHDDLPADINPNFSWFYIGPANSYSALHIDVMNTSAWNAVTSGKKLWLFFPPDQDDYLYNGMVNPFDANTDKFPYYLKARPFVCEQGAGDIVYTPSGWWHAVLNVEPTISITENFVNETNYLKVAKFLKENRMLTEYGMVEQLARRRSAPPIPATL